MNEELDTFIRTYLGLDVAYDTSGFLRPTLMSFKESFVQGVRDGLLHVIRARELSVEEYEGMTDVEFPDEAALYVYLEALYTYLFEGASSQPAPPA
ncbi:hypothetical protein C3489_17380 [Streptomyces sp. Ru71]|uniref:hypothetical protein n=1 Tax=Streptomyces sp. Ru71 TaxID=2080746 RepID=UPI000CDDE0F7|nr:hypothetical protein [Streptomyces sp. Ru71]POX52785.1 hypothetical protein C3489_17380 [Streptomyces sp. Ru71]